MIINNKINIVKSSSNNLCEIFEIFSYAYSCLYYSTEKFHDISRVSM